MNALGQFLTTLLGALIGVAIASGFVKRSRGHLIRAVCMAVTVAFTLPIYSYSLEGWRYGLFVLPLLGGFLGGAGWFLGGLIDRALKGGQPSD